MALEDAIRGLEDVAEKLKNNQDILAVCPEEDIRALSVAHLALKRLRHLNLSTWVTCMATSDGEPIDGTDESHAAISFTDEVTEEEFSRLLDLGIIEEDTRFITTTPVKGLYFMEHLGLAVKRKEEEAAPAK